MLNNLHYPVSDAPMRDNRYDRNLKEDIKIAFDALFDFKQKLSELHPECTQILEKLMQNPHMR